MGLLSQLKSVLGLDTEDRDREDVSVTVERTGSREGDAETATEGSAESPAAETGTEASSASSAAESDAPADDGGPGGAASSPGEDADTTEADAEAADADAEAGPGAAPVDTIKGIGPAYGERLADAGVDTVADLAAADAAPLADEIDVSDSRVSQWIERAGARLR
jgi:predicted flap endonuclease-1-like 5' DNA nuclease